MHWNRIVIAGILAMTLNSLGAAEDRYLKAFPPAGEGMTRFVILLPHKERGEDQDFKVEIYVGKEMETDGVNMVRLGGKIEAKPLKGWGFTYYEVAKFGPAMSTRIGVRPGTKPVKKFVTMPSTTIGYNSRIPLVVYVPQGGAVRYRIWKAGDKTEQAKEG
ncbi:MAG TPA: proteinase inhibitor I4 serpin [Planctomycetaceae bacterium]|nr:proteinase inhibitor I4 serpin [Blastopirellula sp.]HAY78515.1 proteinase inhibitor I4 serpin [Planctomycetaceae bacterium]